MTQYVAAIRHTQRGPSPVVDIAALEAMPANLNTWGGYRPAPIAPGFDVVKLWQVDGVDNLGAAHNAVTMLLVGEYVGSDITVTRIYPPEPTADERLESARRVLRADYWADVRNVADDIRSAIESRDLDTEDAVAERLDEIVDGHSRVIYTGQAIEGLLYTDNESAYYDAMGQWPDDESPWFALMYYAFRADILDTLGDIADLIGAAAPDECEDCGEPLPDDHDSDKCADCEDEAEGDDERHERAHEAGSDTLVPRDDCPECQAGA